MALEQYFAAVKKWWWLVVASTLVATIAGYIAVSRMPRIYQATTTLMVGQSLQKANPTNQDLYISEQLAQTYRQIATHQPILRGAAEALGLPYVPGADSVSAWLVPGTQLLGIGVRDTDAERARALADAIAQQLILQTPNEVEEQQARQGFVRTQLQSLEGNIRTTEEEIQAEQEKLDAANSARAIQQYQTNINALQQKLASYQSTYASLLGSVEARTNFISVFQPATTPTSPISPHVMETVLLAAASGLILAVAGALLIEFLDDTVKTPDDLRSAADLNTLGAVSRFPDREGNRKPFVAEEPLSIIAEAYRTLRTNIQISAVDESIRSLTVTSPSARDGKSTTVANLGVMMAQTGKSVILVDADLRRSALHKYFQVPNKQGLTSVLLQDEPTLDGWLVETGVDNLRLLTSGPLPPNPSELLGSQKMQRLIENLGQAADMIILDTPPSLPVTDAVVLAIETDGVLLVADAGRTRRGTIRQAAENLRRAGASVLGVVLNRVSFSEKQAYYYGYPSHPNGHRKQGKKKRAITR